ncbi:CHAT domain-containing protein [Streptomyces sp. 1222.2]|uniref:CHAT domain-containing protein n=1 Tax=Streptomyces sp. 1222.2 TaxID=1938833 RepID=UPI000BCAB5D2|nr:CHAT domain-containing protein [Streptomyces sp. 1222.2]SOD79189.1 CHAT domain-containing protein [Streptomyces sp. 1222.2]
MPKQQKPSVVEDFRDAMQTGQNMHAWLERHDENFDELFIWARNNDSKVLQELRRQPHVHALLGGRAEESYLHAHSSSQSIFWISEELLHEGFPHYKNIWVKSLLQRGDSAHRLAVYQGLVDELRPTYGGRRKDWSVERGGWVYLLVDAGNAAFKQGDRELAISFFDEAWESKEALPDTTPETAKAVTRVASAYGMAAGYLPEVERYKECLNTALARLSAARQLLRDHLPNRMLCPEILEIGIGAGEVWRNLRKRERCGWLTAAGHSLEGFNLAEHDLRLATGKVAAETRPGDYDYATLLAKDRPKAVRYLLDAAGAAEIFGEFDVSRVCAHEAMSLSSSSSDKLRARLQLIRLERDRTARIDGYEQLLRDDFGERHKWPGLNSRVKKQLSDAASEGSKILKHLERPTASWFWSRLATEWDQGMSPRGRAGRAPEPDATRGWETPSRRARAAKTSTAPRPKDHIAPSTAAPSGDIGELENRLRTEHIPGLVQTLLRLSHRAKVAPPAPALLEQLGKVDQWRPLHRDRRADKLPVEQCRSWTDVSRVCAEMADEFAQGYAPQYRPEILSRLATNRCLDASQRQAVAKEACQISLQAGQPEEAIKGQLELVRSLRPTERPGTVEPVSKSAAAACDIMHNSLGVVSGTADLIDVAHSLTKSSAQLTGLLARQGYEEWAFNAAHAPLGALSRAFIENPDLVEEFELAESRQHSPTPQADEWLFDAMLKRVKKGGTSQNLKTSPKPDEVAAPFGHRVTFVQLLQIPKRGGWALGAEVTGRNCRYWSSHIETTPPWLNQIRKRIATQAPNQMDLLNALRDLHARVVCPWLDQLPEKGTVVFIPHRNFASLPLHGALGPDGYLVEHFRVGYLPNLEPVSASQGIPSSAFVGGWNSWIQAPEQVEALAPRVEDLGFNVRKSRRAAADRNLLLHPTGEWGIVHIMAHGDFHRWPLSSTSKLHLTTQVAVSAGEWLHSGCQASLIFLNACNSGLQEPHAGDLNGFPLALRVRGATSEISCLMPVNAEAAQNFAITFYDQLSACDTLTAYQATQNIILREEPPINWIPYLHVGFPVSLKLQAAEGAK